MRRLKKAGLTLMISSLLLSNNSFLAFAEQASASPSITEVVPLSTENNAGETYVFRPELGPGAPGAEQYWKDNFTDASDTENGELNSSENVTQTETEISGESSSETIAENPTETAPEINTETEINATPETEAVPEVEEEGPLSVPKRIPRIQTTTLLTNDKAWSPAFVNDQQITVENQPFSSISTFLEGIHGDLLYRAYTTSGGWTNWAMNGQQTELADGWPSIEAIQFRFSGPVADQYDIYYTASISDNTNTSWAKNGETCGTMNQGLTMTGFRLFFAEKETDPGFDLSNPLHSNHADGIQFIDGVMRYIHGDGSNYTGWGWIGDDRYYFIDSYPVTGWQYINGYKYYFGEDGKMWSDVESLVGSDGPFMIRINKEMNCMTIYANDGGNGYIIPVKSFLVSTGENTPLGTYKTPEKYRWRLMINNVWTQYATRLGSGIAILMHSIIYDAPDNYTVWASTYNNLGIARSAGCIRLTTADSKWIYDHCAIGTTVEVYESPISGPFERPTIASEIPFAQTWDPTDPNLTPEGIEAAKQKILASAQ